IGQVLARLQKLAATGASSNESASRGQDPVGAFLATYLDTLIAEPWIPQLLVREVLAHDSPLRRRFRESFAGPAKQALSGLLVAQTERGRLRADLDVDLAVLS